MSTDNIRSRRGFLKSLAVLGAVAVAPGLARAEEVIGNSVDSNQYNGDNFSREPTQFRFSLNEEGNDVIATPIYGESYENPIFGVNEDLPMPSQYQERAVLDRRKVIAADENGAYDLEIEPLIGAIQCPESLEVKERQASCFVLDQSQIEKGIPYRMSGGVNKEITKVSIRADYFDENTYHTSADPTASIVNGEGWTLDEEQLKEVMKDGVLEGHLVAGEGAAGTICEMTVDVDLRNKKGEVERESIIYLVRRGR